MAGDASHRSCAGLVQESAGYRTASKQSLAIHPEEGKGAEIDSNKTEIESQIKSHLSKTRHCYVSHKMSMYWALLLTRDNRVPQPTATDHRSFTEMLKMQVAWHS